MRCEALTAQAIRASSHPPVSVSHRSWESMNSTKKLVKYFFNFFMPLIKYTTEIDPDRTAMEITKMLSKAGANAILTEYDPNKNYLTAISFRILLNNQPIEFRLPCDWKPVLTILERDRNVPRRYVTEGQAVRVAWRIVHQWVEAQLAIIETKMVKTEQVFLPYAIMRDNKTLYEHVESNPRFLLGSGEE